MKNFLAFCTLLLFSCSSYCQITGWKNFTAPDRSFSVLFPDSVTEKITVDTTKGMKITTKIYQTDLVNKKFGFLIGTTDYGTSYSYSGNAELIANRDHFCKSARIKPLKTNYIKYANKYPGIAFTATNEKFFFKCRIYIVGNRVYILSSLLLGKETAPELDKFLSSFTLLSK